MSAYSELIKNFEKVRSYMQEFYVYGFKSREEYDKKSARSYDDERRRMESWLGDHMSFVRTPEGKNMFISIDSRVSQRNPLYKAFKAKSFTDGDITLHFILLDILHSPEKTLSLPQILEQLSDYLSEFESSMDFDESTVRKKLKEYMEQGVIVGRKEGRKMLYRRAEALPLPDLTDLLHFYSEVAPCGVLGSFLLDKQEEKENKFGFKHHYITSAMDSQVLAMLFQAMRKKCIITAKNRSRNGKEQQSVRLIPLRIFISVQSGRQHLLAYEAAYRAFRSYRLDYLSDVKLEEPSPRFDELRAELDKKQENMWGVTVNGKRREQELLERVEFTVHVEDYEKFIVQRLEREKRIGRVEQLNKNTYRYTAEVHNTREMIPWIRTFICRITELHFSNKALETQFRQDLEEMYRIYGIGEEEV